MSGSGGAVEKAASLKSMVNFWWNYNVGFFRIADSDRHVACREFSIRTVVDEVGCGLVISELGERKKKEGSRALIKPSFFSGWLTNKSWTGCCKILVVIVEFPLWVSSLLVQAAIYTPHAGA